MKKILLVYEDYTELTTTEVYLKKIGFDVLGISNEVLISDQLVGFNPDIIVVNGKGHRVNTLIIGAKLKENRRYLGKVLLIMPNGHRTNPQEMIKLRLDAALENPVDPFKMIQTLAKLGKLDTVSLIEKLKKATLSDPALKQRLNITGNFDTQGMESQHPKESERLKKYQKIIKDTQIDTNQTTFQKSDIKKRQNELKKDWNFEELEELDKLKQEFAAALFKKN